MAAKTEIEVKIRLTGAAHAARLKAALKKIGAKEDPKAFLERNELYDWPDKRLRNAKQLLRVRWGTLGVVPEGKLTFKGPQFAGAKTMKRLEVESRVSDPTAVAELLRALGMIRWWAYEGKRQRFFLSKYKTEISIDHMGALGWYFEIESPNEKTIALLARKLGFSTKDYVVKSYLALAREHFATQKLTFRDLVFSTRRR